MNMISLRMWTCFCRCHIVTNGTIKCMFKFENVNAKFLFILSYQFLGVICAVIITDTCMVASNNEMSATKVFSDDGMQNGLFWPRITHGCWIDDQADPILHIIIF